MALGYATHRQVNKPIVVVCYCPDDSYQGFHYSLRNVGPGVAINIWLLARADNGSVLESAGALGAASDRRLPPTIRVALERRTSPVVVFAEGLASRTAQWTMTINAVTADTSNEVKTEILRLTEASQANEVSQALTIDRLLEAEWPELARVIGCSALSAPSQGRPRGSAM